MGSRGCTHCDGSQAEGVGEGGKGSMAAAAGEVVCSEESRVERGLHWLKETSYILWCDRGQNKEENSDI